MAGQRGRPRVRQAVGVIPEVTTALLAFEGGLEEDGADRFRHQREVVMVPPAG